MKLVYGCFSLSSPAHSINEDSCRMLGKHIKKVAQSVKGQIFGLFDGMGSLVRGGDAARFMGDQLLKYYDLSADQPEISLLTLLNTANKDIAEWDIPPNSKSQRAGGCAGTVALFSGQHGYIFHAGDTTGLLMKADSLKEDEHIVLTSRHTDSQGGITNFWGYGEDLQIEHNKFLFEEDDIILISSDGLTDVMSNEEIASRVRQMSYFEPEECEDSCRKLCQLARKRGSGDDITVLLIYREE